MSDERRRISDGYTSFRFHLAMDTLVSLAIRFPLSGLVGDLHPLDNARAEHTKKSRLAGRSTGRRDPKTAATYSPTSCSTIGVTKLNFSVRNGKRWNLRAIAT